MCTACSLPYGGVSMIDTTPWTETPLDRDPPDRDPPDRDPPDRDPPDRDQDPPVDRQTCVKT